ncbi:hypothetical protein Tco_0805987 [Tanacetum coccineum]
MSIEEMRHEQQLVDYKNKDITNDLGYKRFHSEKIDKEYERDCEIRIRKLKQDFNEWGSKVRKKEQAYNEERYSAARRRMLSITFDDDDEYSIQTQEYLKKFSSTITPALSPEEPADSLIMEDEHLDTIPKTESDEFKKSSVENLVQNPSESADLSDGESEGDSLSEEEIQKDEFKYFSNPLYDLDDEIITNEKILPNQKDLDVVIPIPPGIDKHCFNAESDLLESLLNRDSPIDSTKIDSIFDEFSLPRPPEESNSEISDATIESLSPSPILVEDSDSLMEEIDLFLASDDSMPPGIEIDDYDSEGDIRFLEELLSNDSPPLPENESFSLDHFDDPSLPRPPPEPPDVEICFNFEPDAGVVTKKVNDKDVEIKYFFFLQLTFTGRMLNEMLILKENHSNWDLILTYHPPLKFQNDDSYCDKEEDNLSFAMLLIKYTIPISRPNEVDDISERCTKFQDLKTDFTVAFDSIESSILPPPLLDSDSPFTVELSASVTLNSLGNEDKIFKTRSKNFVFDPGISTFHFSFNAVHLLFTVRTKYAGNRVELATR